MKEGGPWRIWTIYLLLAAGNIYSPIVNCQSYSEGGARGDSGDASQLGFDGVLARHDGYVKGETPTIPQTSFSCSAQSYNPGLYADVETQCQVYHVCFEDRQESFLCGPGTNFNQRILACDFWYNFDCQNSPSFYNVNADIGKTPDAIYNVGQGREPQQPSYPNFPRQPEQPPSGGSYPPRVTVPPPPPRVIPQRPEYQPQQPPVFRPDPPRPQPRPEPPRIQPQPRPEPPRIQPQPRPEPPRIQPQPRPEPPRIQPQPRPEPPRFDVKPEYPSQRPTVGQGGRVTPQRPSIQQEEDSGYQFEGNNPQQPEYLPPPPPPRPQTPRPVFPPVVSPPRVSRPPLTPPVIRQPEGSISRPRVPTSDIRPDFHPDSNLKGNVDYVPPQQPYQPQPPRIPQQSRVPQPSRPVGTGYPSYPVSQRPVAPRPEPQRPVDRPYQPPPTLQQEHIDTDYIPPQPKEPSRPSTSYVPPPPPPRPIQQEVTVIQPPSRPYVPPPPPPRPIQQEVTKVQPPSRPYVPPPPPPQRPTKQEVTVVQPPSRPYVPPPPPPRPIQQEVTNVQPPSRPRVPSPPPRPIQQEVTVVQPPSRPYNPPPPPPRPIQQEITRVDPPLPQRPIDTDYGRPQPPVAPSIISEQQRPGAVPPSRPQVTQGGRQTRPPQRPKPVFPPPSDHPNANIKGGPGYQQPPPQIPRFEPTRIGRPSAPQGVRPRPDVSVNAVKPTGEKRPSATATGGYKVPQQERVKKPSEPPKAIYQPPIQVVDHPRSEIKGSGYDSTASQQPQRIKSPSTATSGVKRPQRPRAPVVVSRPQPPSLPATNIKTASRVDNQIYERPKPQAVGAGRVKSPSQVQPVSRPSCSDGLGGPGCSRPVDHPNANIKGGSYPVNQERRQPSGSGRRPSVGRGAGGCSSASGGCGRPAEQEIIRQPNYEPQRRPQASTGVKTKQPSISQQSVVAKQPKPEYGDGYGDGSSYTRGPDVYPKPEFGQPNVPYQPVSTPSRSSHTVKTASPSQNTITQSDNKPDYQRPSVATGSGGFVRPVPGHQPPNQPQVFPHRENPDHPNESLKGSGAYRPPPPAGFQGAASEVQPQQVAPAPEPEPEPSKLLGDIGAE